VVASGRANRTAKLTLADLLSILAHSQQREVGMASCEEARKILADLGATDLRDLTAASAYGDATDTQARLAMRLGRLEESERLATLVGETAEKVLQQRPGDLRAMVNRYYSANVLGEIATTRHQYEAARAHYARSEEAAKNYSLFNPADNLAWRSWNQANLDIGEMLAEQGNLAEALDQYREAAEREKDPRNKTGIDIGVFGAWQNIARLEAQLGNARKARAALAENRRVRELFNKQRIIDEELNQISLLGLQVQEYDILAAEGDYATIHARAAGVVEQMDKIPKLNEGNKQFRENITRQNRAWLIESSLRLGRTEEAATTARDAIERPLTYNQSDLVAKRILARSRVRHGQALLGSGDAAGARAALGEALAYYRLEQQAGANGTSFLLDLGRALYHLARAQDYTDAGRAQRQALLAEAAVTLESLSYEARQIITGSELIKWVRAAQVEAAR
jgi:tetratricopeptide (TPR) repeat protein